GWREYPPDSGGYSLQRSPAVPPSPSGVDVDEAVALVAGGQAGGGQRLGPVAGDGGVRLLHAVVGDEEEGGAVPHAGGLHRVEHLAEAGVGVDHRGGGDLRVGPALVEGGIGEGEVHPAEPGKGAELPREGLAGLGDARVVDP